MKLASILVLALLLSGCAHKKLPQPPPAPEIKAIPPKHKLRPIRPGDYVLQTPEVQNDGSVICHRPILVIDSSKKREDVIVYKCR